MANVDYGDLKALKDLGNGKKNDFTTEQLLDENLKNVDGESNLEVRERMLDFFEDVLSNYKDKRIAIVSHGAAIKFFLQHFCEFNYEENDFSFKNQVVCNTKLESPSVLKFVFDNYKICSICKIIWTKGRP